ncbi:MAG: FAD-dependent oxidoreductase [Reyranella sp.]|uniref:FAD-dependent oxidoreductase n=1 Tax=Reyranella sp. TaxID=1929291 RepID=UPI001AD051FE|nr:FAD-dependent oxidoreductase [Reyranella sp.]MBN9088249.1 FAD-dependent oxidoreductase [Reyranella sp.]
MKVIVIGAGVMGLSTAWGLARNGHHVEIFEQAALPNPQASSMDEHRLIRHPYGDHAGYARMIDPAFAAWDLLWSDLGRKLYAATGTLALTGNGADWAERSALTLAAIGRPMTELTLSELRRRFPQLNAGGVERAFWLDTGGVLFAQDIVTALARYLANQSHVRLRADMQIRTVDLDLGRVTANDGTVHEADMVVVAAGAWVGRLLPMGQRLLPSRQIVIYFRLPEDQRAVWAKGPMIIEKTGDVGLYFVPPMEGRGFKVGDHEFSRTGDPDGGREAREEEIAPLIERCRGLFKGFDSWTTDRLKVCFYTVTDDERFVVEKTGAKGWVMSPCSGHGFKFGALMGLELARTIASNRDPLQHARWAAGLEGE